jgi:hypothetical protein
LILSTCTNGTKKITSGMQRSCIAMTLLTLLKPIGGINSNGKF